MDKDTLALATEILGEEEVASMRRSHRLPARKPVFGKPAHKLPPAKDIPRGGRFVQDEIKWISWALTKVSNGAYPGTKTQGIHPRDVELLKKASDRLAWVVSTLSNKSDPAVREPGVASSAARPAAG